MTNLRAERDGLDDRGAHHLAVEHDRDAVVAGRHVLGQRDHPVAALAGEADVDDALLLGVGGRRT